MANIVKAQYSNVTNITIRIDFDAGDSVFQPANTSNSYRYTNDLIEWIDDGNIIEPFDEYLGMSIEQIRVKNQDAVDLDCSKLILSYWSKNAQSNASLGLYDQVTCELCKSEISSALIENKTFIDAIELLETASEIDDYVDAINRTELTGGRP